jgi:hypothetical protein
MLLASAALCHGEPVAATPRWQVVFPHAAGGGKALQTTAVPLNRDSLLVTVVLPGADPSKSAVQAGSQAVSARMIGHDPVSRLGFLKTEGPVPPRAAEWLESAASGGQGDLQALTPGGPVKCRGAGWVKQIGGKVLPLALLRVEFGQTVPPPGSPVMDPAGRVLGIVFQAAGNGNAAYVIPAEAVQRVRRDICNGGRLVRGWLGLSLLAENKAPRIVRVLPGSPAAKAGIKPDDLLLNVGPRRISDYPDAANAFFYLVPGEPVRVKLRRGNELLEFTLTPARPPAG